MTGKVATDQFTIAKAPFEDIGKDRVRLHWKRRLGKRRFVILKLQHGTRRALVSALGHEESEDVIQMDIDLRDKLGLEPGKQAEISVALAPWHQQLCWYLNATDPAVRIPAWLGIWSFAIGVLSIFPVFAWLTCAARVLISAIAR
ncbi:hypothetical protein KYK29_15705 [Shinella daejeonensis]|uniref:hypothetical protein n=1 Tax=Shinella daejeonensis TaxID=659017 RepID=UPI0020C749A7|nr:hypothetical protein [Shinella daejeonensis]MCP8896373.1 hypothetical protein [Shinella daejeonensis]